MKLLLIDSDRGLLEMLLIILFNTISVFMHMWSEKFEVVGASRTGDFMIITELRGSDASRPRLLFHKSWKVCLKTLDCPHAIWIFMRMTVRSNHGVMSGGGNLVDR